MSVHTPVAVLLVAGIGSRLAPLTDNCPKALLDLGNETMLGRAIRILSQHGVEEIVLATGYLDDTIKAATANAPVPVTLCPNPEFRTTQNSVSLAHCEQAIAGRAFFKLDGDVLFSPAVLQRLSEAPEGIATAVERRDDMGDEEMKVLVGEGERITAFGKGLDPKACFGESIGIERVSGVAVSSLFHALRQAVDAGRTDLYYEDIYSEEINRGIAAHLVDVSDLPWTEVDTLEDLEKAKELLATGAL